MNSESKLIWESYISEAGKRSGRRTIKHQSQTDAQDRMSFSFTDDTSIKWEYFKNLPWISGSIKHVKVESPRRTYNDIQVK